MSKITVFSAEWCNPCKALKKTLNEEGIPYDIVDIDSDMDAAVENGVRGVPTTIITADDGSYIDRVVGFDQNTLKKIQEAAA